MLSDEQWEKANKEICNAKDANIARAILIIFDYEENGEKRFCTRDELDTYVFDYSLKVSWTD